MEKILFNSNSFDVRNSGIKSYNDRLSVNLVNVSNTLDEVETMLLDPANTNKISLVSESGETLRIFNGFTKLVEVSKEKDAIISSEIVDDEEIITRGDVITIVLDKESDTEARLSALEETVDILVLENLGM